jgi:hypothetical protein
MITQGHPLLKNYKQSVAHLPSENLSETPKTQWSLIILHLPHHLFSANFLVPFFAHHTSLHVAGIIKITSELAAALKTVLKSSISFPLHTLMLKHTEHSQAIINHFLKVVRAAGPKILNLLAIFIIICGAAATISKVMLGLWLQNSIMLFAGFCILVSADYTSS